MKPSRSSSYRRASSAVRKPPVEMAVDLQAFDAMFDEIEGGVSEALRPAVQAGAEVIYQAVLRNVGAIKSLTGNLRSSIYQAFVEKQSTQAEGGYSKVRYDVSWNPKKAPHGHLVEYGHIQKFKVYLKDGKWYTNKKEPLATPKQVAAHPFMRPAFTSAGAAADAVTAKFWEGMKK